MQENLEKNHQRKISDPFNLMQNHQSQQRKVSDKFEFQQNRKISGHSSHKNEKYSEKQEYFGDNENQNKNQNNNAEKISSNEQFEIQKQRKASEKNDQQELIQQNQFGVQGLPKDKFVMEASTLIVYIIFTVILDIFAFDKKFHGKTCSQSTIYWSQMGFWYFLFASIFSLILLIVEIILEKYKLYEKIPINLTQFVHIAITLVGFVIIYMWIKHYPSNHQCGNLGMIIRFYINMFAVLFILQFFCIGFTVFKVL